MIQREVSFPAFVQHRVVSIDVDSYVAILMLILKVKHLWFCVSYFNPPSYNSLLGEIAVVNKVGKDDFFVKTIYTSTDQSCTGLH